MKTMLIFVIVGILATLASAGHKKVAVFVDHSHGHDIFHHFGHGHGYGDGYGYGHGHYPIVKVIKHVKPAVYHDYSPLLVALHGYGFGHGHGHGWW